MKKKIISIFLVMVMMLTYVTPFVYAINVSEIDILLNDKVTSESDTYTITSEDNIKIKASHPNGILKVRYAFDGKGETERVYTSDGSKTSLTVKPIIPNDLKDGDKHKIAVIVDVISYDPNDTDGVKSTNKEYFYFQYKVTSDEVFVPTINLKADDKYLHEFVVTRLDDDKIDVDISGIYGIEESVYKFDDSSKTYTLEGREDELTIPSKYLDGEKHTMKLKVVSVVGTESIWYEFPFIYQEEIFDTDNDDTTMPDITVKANGDILKENNTYIIDEGTMTLKATHSSGIRNIVYCFDEDEKEYTINGNSKTIDIPTKYLDGNRHCILVLALSENGVYSDWEMYWFKADVDLPIVKATYNDSEMKTSKTYLLDNDEYITLKATHSSGIDKIIYCFDDDEKEYTINGSSAKIDIPEKYRDGELHYLLAIALSEDGNWSAEYVTYKFMFQEEGDEKYPLIVLSDEKVNNDVIGLSIALRTVPQSTKTGNKNIFALNEEIEYNIDFANGGVAIDEEVTIDLDIPSGYTVSFIDKNGAEKVNSRRLRWTFEDGLEANEKGTIPVTLKYTAIQNNANTVKPYATIKSGSKNDSSATINYIYKNANTTVSTTHNPYMYGDAGTNTFRPNDGLNRAEMAALLVRIFNLPRVSNAKVTYTDANVIAQDQYRWATNDIMTVSQYGLMQGYEDGEFKPGAKVTKAQIITILARKFAVDGGDETTKNAFAVKDEPIKLFNNLSLVYANYGYDSHWAETYLAQMIRLNMLPEFTNTVDGNLDSVITRAETAKLINTILFRGPSTDGTANSSLTNKFVDVNVYTKNYEHILEATADTHNSKYTTRGKETMVK